MNPFLNPFIALPFLKNFLFDARRLRSQSSEKIGKYRDKALQRTLRYADSVPLYHSIYQAAGLNIQNITGMKDITKIPLVSKPDLVAHYPDEILPRGYHKENTRVVSTAGSTGKQISIYTDFSVFSGGVGAMVRIFEYLGLPWRTSRLANIGNFNPHMADSTAENLFYSKASFVYGKDNRISLNAFLPVQDIIAQLDRFKPDVIYSYPATFFHLAYYKRNGYGEHINPKALLVSGSVLEPYTRSYVEEAFGCKMHNGYGSVETFSEAPIAFECREGTWHINYDFFHVEAIDEQKNLVENGKQGHIVVTRLFGKATPIVRYTGLDDWVVLSDDEACACGLHTPVLKGGVEGRKSDSVVLPDGRLFPAASFASLYSILNELKTRKVRQFQIVQKTLDEIDILVIIDETLRDVGPSVDVIFEKIKEIHQIKAGPGVQIFVREVQDIPSQKGKPAPLVISHVRADKGYRVIGE
jgi:phenylacetate-coenzyme A ligase PaaK-like adenylate-forming protein